MGQIRQPEPVLLVVGLFSNSDAAIALAEESLERVFGPICQRGGPFPFVETTYYEAEMGRGLRYELLAIDRLIYPDWIAPIKVKTNEMEEELTRLFRTGPDTKSGRVANIDPGYLSAGKFVLATTKDQAHRIYVGNGIYAEVTLYFGRGEFRPWPWTYPNYRREDYRETLKQFRQTYMQKRREWRNGDRKVAPLPFAD